MNKFFLSVKKFDLKFMNLFYYSIVKESYSISRVEKSQDLSKLKIVNSNLK